MSELREVIPIIQSKFEDLMLGRDGLNNIERIEKISVGQIDLNFFVSHPKPIYGEENFRSSRYVTGSINNYVLFIRRHYYPAIMTFTDEDEYDDGGHVEKLFRCDEEAVDWSIVPKEGLVQTLSYRPPTNWELSYVDQEEQFQLGYSSLYVDGYPQSAKYDKAGQFRCHWYVGTDYIERPNWHSVRPVSLLIKDGYRPIPLQVVITRSDQIQIEEFDGENLVQGFTFPVSIDPVEWKKILLDEDDIIIKDPIYPWMNWFDELGIALNLRMSTNYQF